MKLEIALQAPHPQLDITLALPSPTIIPYVLVIATSTNLINFEAIKVPLINVHLLKGETLKKRRKLFFSYRTVLDKYTYPFLNLPLKNTRSGYSVVNCLNFRQRRCGLNSNNFLVQDLQLYFRPSTTILMILSHRGTLAAKSLLKFKYKNEFSLQPYFSSENDVVFLMEYLITGFLRGYVSCSSCDLFSSDQHDFKGTMIPHESFHCASGCSSPCWQTMASTLSHVTLNGKQVFWGTADPTSGPELFYMSYQTHACLGIPHPQAPGSKHFFGDWQLTSQIEYVLSLGSNQSVSSVDEFQCPMELGSTSSTTPPAFSCSGTQMNAQTAWFLKRPFTAEDLIFITEVNIKQKFSAIDLYIKVLESKLWYASIGTFLLASIAFALLSSFDILSHRYCHQLAHRVSRFLSFFAQLFLDQCHAELPDPDRKPAVFCMVIPWLFAVLILSNGFEGALKSRFSMAFPYKLASFESWADFTEYSLYFFGPPSYCNFLSQYRQVEPQVVHIEESWLMSELTDGSEEWICTNSEATPPNRASIFFTWSFSPVRKALMSEINSFSVFAYCDRPGVNESKYCINHASRANKLGLMDARTELICPQNMSEFSGREYFRNVHRWKSKRNLQEAGVVPTNWTLKSNSSCSGHVPHFGEIRGDADIAKVFWMTRKYKSAFVTTSELFPWQWNLFKKLMRADYRIKFAHSGSNSLQTTRAQLVDRNPCNFMYFVPLTLEHGKWMARRISFFFSSGILDFWHKWDKILRPLVTDSIADEISDAEVEFKPLRLEDPSLYLLFIANLVLFAVCLVVFCLEVIIHQFQHFF